MQSHFLVLLVAIPLIAAPVCVLIKSRALVWALVSVVSGICFLLSVKLLILVSTSETALTYAIGFWDAPVGIQYRLDMVAAIVAFIVSLIAFIVALYSRVSLKDEIKAEKIPLFYSAYLLCLTGLLGITVTGDAFNLFVFMEISSLASYALISMGKNRAALISSFRYLIMGTIGATFLLIGIGLMYAHTGTLNMTDLAQRLPALLGKQSVQVSLAFIVIGLAIKSALFPVHIWLPGAYTHAPISVSAFLAGTATKVSIYALIRFLFTVFDQTYAVSKAHLGPAFIILAVVAMLFGSILALKQDNLKRMLAYSSIAQIGYLFLGIGLFSVSGLSATITHIFNHAIIKTTLFLVLGCMIYKLGHAQLSQLNGIGKRMPWTTAAFVIAGLSLIGVPLTAGFTSKWALVSATLEQEYLILTALIMFTSLLAIVYIWRVVEAAYFKEHETKTTTVKEAPLALLIPLWMLVILNIYFGIDTTINIEFARQAADSLFGS